MNKLWTKNFTLIIVSTTLGCIGGIAGGFALSFLVYEETASTFASALVFAISIIPGFVIPLFISPIMDRLPRKPFLVGGDIVASILYFIGGLWLKNNEFNYITYLMFSLILACVRCFDELSYNAIYPKLIPEGMEEKGYAVSSMLYPIINIIMMPVAAFLFEKIGTANILLIQSFMGICAAISENQIDIVEEKREGTNFSIVQWWEDIKEAFAYLKNEKGLLSLILYSSTSNGLTEGHQTIMVAFFSTMPGFSITMYSFFSVMECIGRTIGGIYMYKNKIKDDKKYWLALFVYIIYETMDGIVLWISYPLMLINRTICGFLGIQSGTIRYAAVQKYIPDQMRARCNAFSNIVYLIFSAILSLIIGVLGEFIDCRILMSGGAVLSLTVLCFTIIKNKKDIEKIYLYRPSK